MVSDALWGLAGALIYAGARLIAQLLGAEVLTGRRTWRAVAQFTLAMVAGPAFAAALSSTVMKIAAAHADVDAVAFLLGLSANTIWPIFVDGVGRRARIWSGETEP